jgi:hypothetical protein
MLVYIVFRDDYEHGGGIEYSQNTEVVGVRLSEESARKLVDETYGEDNPSDVNYGVRFETHEATPSARRARPRVRTSGGGAMLVRDLIAALQKMPQDKEVQLSIGDAEDTAFTNELQEVREHEGYVSINGWVSSDNNNACAPWSCQ